ncbi:hypothetical protein [Streptomyces sp. CB02959]|uniref:hypothetical protein n=1 Tax=Streptomyces sp. CB02959 TaxID=2020330 RepID=UPI0011AF0419|nr:hypothetical protein [Streptomyces sp. CB02959]
MFRFLRRKRRGTPSPSMGGVAVVDVTAFPDRHADRRCTDYAVVAQPLGPLVTEMIALHTHTRHLSWLSEREQCRDSYKLLARSIVREVLAGWHHQTDGHGTIHDLLTEDARCARGGRVPEQQEAQGWESSPGSPGPGGAKPPRPAQWWSQKTFEGEAGGATPSSAVLGSSPVSHEPDLGGAELTRSAPGQGVAPWWSYARGHHFLVAQGGYDGVGDGRGDRPGEQ